MLLLNSRAGNHMAILIFQHEAIETPARIGEALNEVAHRVRIIELYDGQKPPADLDNVDGIVVMGGPQNVDQVDQHPWMAAEIELIRQAHVSGVPVLGVCLGAQLIAAALGGKVEKMGRAEIGWRPIRLTFPGTVDPILAGIPWNTVQFHSHAYEITELPPEATPLASSELCKHQAFRVGLTTYAFQYHFEWTSRDLGRIIERFGGWFREHGEDPATITSHIDSYYDLHRHLGDRLCNNLANLLFPIDKRLDHKIGPVQNYHAHLASAQVTGGESVR